MTDNEIINQWKHERELAECVCSYFVDQVELSLVNETIDIINQQKEEIERLKGSVIVNNIMESQKIKREAKIETVKEFAERLKEKSFQSFGNYGITRYVVEVCDIDNLVKEMVGENK